MNVNAPSGGINLPYLRNRPQRKERRIRGFEWVPNKIRNHFIAMLGEFCGTFLFLFFAFSATQVANAATSTEGNDPSGQISQAPNTSALLYIALAFGFSLAVNAWVFFRISGGLFNPAVTLGMCLIGAVNWIRGGLAFISQILGAIAAAAVVSALFPGPLNVTTSLSNSTSVVRGLFIEMFLTSMLVFTIFMLAAEKHKGTFLAPIGIGLALFIAELSGVFFTGGSLNPARSFGPCVVLHEFPHAHWIYWVGPALGACLAVGFYGFIKTLEYETANPGQDFNDKEAEVFTPDDDAASASEVRAPNASGGEADHVSDHPGTRRSRESQQPRTRSTSNPKSQPTQYDGPSPPQDLAPAYNTRSRDQRPSDRFNNAAQVEEGAMGGNYKVYGL